NSKSPVTKQRRPSTQNSASAIPNTSAVKNIFCLFFLALSFKPITPLQISYRLAELYYIVIV
ncbi:MAG: hypothetical protein IKJ19_02400, partial [Clostridia bacterium]|nr:hypothetical protein [Clostridia bacterium]